MGEIEGAEAFLADCAACHAVLPQGVRYCPECGLDSQSGDAAIAPPSARER